MASSIRLLSILVLFVAVFVLPAMATAPVTPTTPTDNNDDDEWTTYVLAALVGIMGLLLLLGLLALVLIRSQSDNGYDDVGYRGISLPYATRSGNSGYAPVDASQATAAHAGGLPPVLTPPTSQMGLEGPSLMPPMAGPSSSVEAPPVHNYHKDAFYHV